VVLGSDTKQEEGLYSKQRRTTARSTGMASGVPGHGKRNLEGLLQFGLGKAITGDVSLLKSGTQ
jgi:hypothetical protein